MQKENLICPYCGEEQYTHEPDSFTAHLCYTQCEHCDKWFLYSVNVTREYEAWQDKEE